MNDWNDKVIEEFRANEGRVGGNFEGAPILLLHSTGAKSGQERVSPMMYQVVGESLAVFASKAGADDNPDWYHNLLAHPEARIEVGTETLDVTARVLDAGYEEKTDRVIPVVMLDRR
jgi:deazaflavin-dependent oxidoreductase (nitroreductase family)